MKNITILKDVVLNSVIGGQGVLDITPPDTPPSTNLTIVWSLDPSIYSTITSSNSSDVGQPGKAGFMGDTGLTGGPDQGLGIGDVVGNFAAVFSFLYSNNVKLITKVPSHRRR